eukprot:CAMPEP_0174318096 /NCGR_PEP_ID=MMETSP0810-20121108/7988_1 /TAXON_ID=73025 ORGANISM="Eutreptiella gymnastica-like, Strain CCMP1594" /NCGR_SAMPLE_ID=MMETSP0810 /ASSEMBLY_ACC=CAM_ASM_000659 /LENGTH=48 /DNA_ID= /DNA_START= /DNA_END= /DNA_ORIENTATION=
MGKIIDEALMAAGARDVMMSAGHKSVGDETLAKKVLPANGSAEPIEAG